MKSRRKYRVAVVGGAGTWGRHYLHAYANHPDCEIIALVDRARDRRKVFADHYGVKVVFDSVEELLRRDVPDIVSAIVPTGASHDVVIACAEAGVKAVSCEKPMAAELAKADEMVRVCRERSVAFGCGTAYWDVPYAPETAEWVRKGRIGRLTAAAIPWGLPREVSGGGCVQITLVRLLTGMEVEWVEGWTLPPDAAANDDDCGAYGRFGLSGGILCEVPKPKPTQRGKWHFCPATVTGTYGQAWLCPPKPVLFRGKGHSMSPVFPKYLEKPLAGRHFDRVVERLMRAVETGEEAQCSGHDYRQALEVAIAMKLSARRGHQRVTLPLEDRSVQIVAAPYRMLGGDVAGWSFVGNRVPAVS
ncbi:MAG: Gfo/Idh/MocA family oxidoreductase [Planctomycetes bacterium]|nr:Gfo/Idh/MocA family oxidoreductase [Planctomycetota bacterium]